MENPQKTPTRKKFLIWGAAVLSSLTFMKIFANKQEEKNETIKMLTQDGQLVEIDKKLLTSSAKKISDEELKKWVKK
jgi:hypothetical protein